MSLLQTEYETGLGNKVDDAMYRTCGDITGVACHAAVVKLAAQCRQFLDKKFKEFLTIFSPGVKADFRNKEVISRVYSNTR